VSVGTAIEAKAEIDARKGSDEPARDRSTGAKVERNMV
jgi:hypothetical protein